MTRRRRSAIDRVVRGAAAGAAGTTALNAITYADILLRARPSSDVPAKMAGVLAGHAGLRFLALENETEAAQHRRQAVGALLGYMTGAAIGAAYGVIQPSLGRPSRLAAGLALGLSAMAASDIPFAVTGVSDPRTWSLTDWLSDTVPHLIYGLATATIYGLEGD